MGEGENRTANQRREGSQVMYLSITTYKPDGSDIMKVMIEQTENDKPNRVHARFTVTANNGLCIQSTSEPDRTAQFHDLICELWAYHHDNWN